MELSFPHENRMQIVSFDRDGRHVILKKTGNAMFAIVENEFLNTWS